MKRIKVKEAVKEARDALEYMGPKKETSSKLKKTKNKGGETTCKRWRILYKNQSMRNNTIASSETSRAGSLSLSF